MAYEVIQSFSRKDYPCQASLLHSPILTQHQGVDMNVENIQKAYEMAVDAMMQATPEMPREVAEKAVEAIAELVLAVINSELSEEEIQNAIKH
jgi:hypothetical protein